MFTIKRDQTIDATIGNLIMSGVLMPEEVARYMARLGTLNDDELARQLVGSKRLLDGHYNQMASEGRD
jgi:hypothetical protein